MGDENTLKITADAAQAKKELRDLGDVAQQTGQQVSESLGGQNQEENLARFTDIVKRYGESLGLTGSALEEFVGQMVELTDVNDTAELSEEELTQAFEAQLATVVGSNVELKKRVDILNKQKDAAKAAGQAEDQYEASIRQLRTRLKELNVELLNARVARDKERDANGRGTDAYRKLADEVDRLEKEEKQLIVTTARLSAAQANQSQELGRATKRAGQFGDDIKSLNQAIQAYAPNFVKLGYQVAIVAQAFRAFGEIAQAIPNALNAYGVELDKVDGVTKDAVASFGEFATKLASLDFAGAAAGLGQMVGNIIAWAQGLGDSNVKLGPAAKLQAEANRLWLAGTDALKALKTEHEAVVTKLGATSEALVKLAAEQEKNGKVEQWVRDELKKTIDTYESMGMEVPANLKTVTDSLEIFTKKVEESAKRRAEAEKKATDESIKSYNALGDKYVELGKKIEELRAKVYGGGAAEETDLDRKIAKLKEEVAELNGQASFEDPTKFDELSRKRFELLQAEAAKSKETNEQKQKDYDELNKLEKERFKVNKLGMEEYQKLQDLAMFGNKEAIAALEAGTEAGRKQLTLMDQGLIDAWEQYYRSAEQTNIVTKKVADGLFKVGDAAGKVAQSYVEVTDQEGNIKKIVAQNDEWKNSVQKVGDVYTNEMQGVETTIEELADGTLLITNQTGALVDTAEEVKEKVPEAFKQSAESLAALEETMERVNNQHLPQMKTLVESIAGVLKTFTLGRGGPED